MTTLHHSANPTGTEARVCADIAQRQQLGIQKYGVTVAANPLPLRAWLEHAYQEVLDTAVYLRRAMDDMDRQAQWELAEFEARRTGRPDNDDSSRSAP
jgi:hypothetical protein